MTDSCFIDAGGFWDATKDVLDKDTAKKVFDDLKNRALIKEIADKSTKAEALYKAALDATDNIEKEAALAKYRTMLNYFASKTIDQVVGRYSNPLEGLESTLIGKYADIKESLISSTELAIKTQIAQTNNALLLALEQADVYKTFKDNSQSRDIAREIWQLGSTTNLAARKVAEIWKPMIENQRLRQNELGANIGSIEEYMGAQTHNPEKLLQEASSFRERMAMRRRAFMKHGMNWGAITEELNLAAYTRWKNYTLQRLDMKRTFSDVADDDIDKFMKGAWNGLVTGIHGTLPSDEATDFDSLPKLFKNYGDKISASRKLHFKDGGAWQEYAKEYGAGSVQEAMVNSLKRGASNIALMSKWGVNPRRMFDIKLQDAKASASRLDFLDKEKINTQSAKLQSYFDMLDGTAYIPLSSLGARTGAALRAWQAYAKLGMVAISSLGDVALRAEMMRGLGTNPLAAYAESISDLLKGRPTGEMRDIANSLGVWAESSFGHMSYYMADSSNPYGMVSKNLMRYTKLTGLDWMDETNRLASGTFLSRYMATKKNIAYDKLPDKEKVQLNMYGFGQKEWDLMRDNDNVYRVQNGKQFITPDASHLYSNASIAKYLDKEEGGLSEREIKQVKTSMHDRLMTFFIDKTNDAILRPGIKTARFTTKGLKKGTWGGEIMRFAFQFKSYPVEYLDRIIGRKLFGVRIDKGQGLQFGSPDIAGLVNVLIGTTVLGYVSMQAKNILKNKTLRPADEVGTWIAALLQGGGLGLYGDFLFGQFNRFGQSIIESLAGPVPVSLEQGAKVLYQLAHMQDASNQTWQFLKNNMPLLNLFYLRTSLDFLFLNGLQEQINPGSLQRYNDQMSEQNDQQYLFNPLGVSLIGR